MDIATGFMDTKKIKECLEILYDSPERRIK
jgi:hypothetical protein